MGMYPEARIFIGIRWNSSMDDTFEQVKEYMSMMQKEFEYDDTWDFFDTEGIEHFSNGMTGEAFGIGISIYNTDWDVIELDTDKLHPESLEKIKDKVRPFLRKYLNIKEEPKLLMYGNYD